jgi:glutathione peroxidase
VKRRKTAPSIHEIVLPLLNGQTSRLADYDGKVVLAVNVASKCGLTPQYAGLQRLYETYADRGFTVLGFPCNQFDGQEPGTAKQIEEFCTLNYGVSFPVYTKLDVKGSAQHPLYKILTAAEDDTGKAGDVTWNFEKFLVGRNGRVVRRFRPQTVPEDPTIVNAIEGLLQA